MSMVKGQIFMVHILGKGVFFTIYPELGIPSNFDIYLGVWGAVPIRMSRWASFDSSLKDAPMRHKFDWVYPIL